MTAPSLPPWPRLVALTGVCLAIFAGCLAIAAHEGENGVDWGPFLLGVTAGAAFVSLAFASDLRANWNIPRSVPMGVGILLAALARPLGAPWHTSFLGLAGAYFLGVALIQVYRRWRFDRRSERARPQGPA